MNRLSYDHWSYARFGSANSWMGDLLGTFDSQTILEQRHLAATDCSISTDCAELTALICLEPLLAWIVRDSLCPKLVNWSSRAWIAFLQQTWLHTETGCFTWWGMLSIVSQFQVPSSNSLGEMMSYDMWNVTCDTWHTRGDEYCPKTSGT